MTYRFGAGILTEGGRAFFKIPFDVWEETGLKGNIPCIAKADCTFEYKWRDKFVAPFVCFDVLPTPP